MTPLPVPRAEELFVRTRDGWKLAVYRYRPARQTSVFGPVLLVHGLSANRFNLDAPDPEISLAKYLAAHDHDVWVVELRGAGRSRPPGWPLRQRAPFDFDDYIHRDVPALLRRILDDTAARALHWVGHSMGGMVAYAALEHYDQRLFASVVTIGSPAFTAVKHPLVDQLYRLRFLLKVLPWLPTRPLAQLGSLFPGLALDVLGHIVGNPENMERRHVQRLLRQAIANLPAPLLSQFAEWYGHPTGFARRDGLFDYYEQMARISAPVLVIAGTGDRLTPVADLARVYESIGSRDKRLILCGRAEGFSADYGHIDLVLGKSARREIYPLIADWIEQHA